MKTLQEMTLNELDALSCGLFAGTGGDYETDGNPSMAQITVELARRQRMLDAAEGMYERLGKCPCEARTSARAAYQAAKENR